MNTFFIFSHPRSLTVAMPVGFSRSAAILGVLWSVFHGLWLPSTMATLVLVAAISGVHGFLDADTDGLVLLEATTIIATWLALCLIFGIYGNLWRKEQLISRGYACVATVEADTSLEAITIFENGKVIRPAWFRWRSEEHQSSFFDVMRCR